MYASHFGAVSPPATLPGCLRPGTFLHAPGTFCAGTFLLGRAASGNVLGLKDFRHLGRFWGRFCISSTQAAEEKFADLRLPSSDLRPSTALPGCRIVCRVAGWLPATCRLSTLRSLGKYDLLPGCRVAGSKKQVPEKNIFPPAASTAPVSRLTNSLTT